MAHSLPIASRCMPHIGALAKLPDSSRTWQWLTPRQRPKCSPAAASTLASNGVVSAPAGQCQPQGQQWSEMEFTSLQKKATSRLHRFYVPEPLGPAPSALTLSTLLAPPPSNNPSAPPPSAATVPPPASPSSSRRRSHTPATNAASHPVTAAPRAPPATVVLEGEEARHAARALRLSAGDRVELCDGAGNVVEGTVAGSDRQRVWVSTDGQSCVHVPWRGSRWVVAVACTTLKGGRAEWLVEKVTELGAAAVIPLVTERSQAGGKAKFRTRASSSSPDLVPSYGHSSADSEGDYAPGRLERVAIAATKQSLRAHGVLLAPPTSLEELLPLVRRAASGGRGGAGGAGVGGEGIGAAVSPPGNGDMAGGDVDLDARTGFGHVGRSEPASGSTIRGSASSSSGGGSGAGVGGSGGSFCLVAVAGAPPLATVMQELRQREGHVVAMTAAAEPRPADQEVDDAGLAGGVGAAAGVVEGSPLRVLVVGPEGDFTPGEVGALVGAGAVLVGLGSNRLRTETAAVGLLAACVWASEEGE